MPYKNSKEWERYDKEHTSEETKKRDDAFFEFYKTAKTADLFMDSYRKFF